MSAIKLILFKGKTYSDDCHPIMLQYTNDGKIKRKVIHKCKAKDWDPKTERLKHRAPNASVINNFLSETFADAEKQLFKVKQGEAVTISYFEGTTNMTVADAIEKERERLKKLLKPTPHAQLGTYKDQLGSLAKTQISHVGINWFNAALDVFKALKNEPATLEKKIKHLRRVLAKYSDSELSKEIKQLKIAIPKTVKQKLTSSELDLVANFPLKEWSNIAISRDIFMLQVYLRGVRIGDLVQAYCHQFAEGRFNYKSEKVGKDMGLKLVPQAIAIIDKYKGNGLRLFPLFKWEDDPALSEFDNEKKRLKHKESCTSIVNNNLKLIAKKIGLSKPLSTHIARHTFARMAIDKINNPMVTMELLGHSSLAIHQAYLNDIRKDDVLDAAADDIFS
jgi:integrase/recombinase XerD